MIRILFSIICISLVSAVFAGINTSDINAQLIQAAEDGNLPPVQKLLADGADVNARAENGTTALMIAAYHGHAEVVKLLLKNGADVNAKTTTGSVTPLWQASQKGHAEVVKLLLEKGADVNAKTTDDGTTPLFIAVLGGHTEVIKLLLAAKADVNIKTNSGDTPLSIAKLSGDDQIIDMLEKAGAKIYESKIDTIAKSQATEITGAKELSTEKKNAFPPFGENKEKDANISNAVAITVNGAKIYERQIAALAKQRAEETGRSNPDFSLAEARKVIVWELVFTEIVLQKGKEKHIDVSEQEIKETISKVAEIDHLSYDEFIKNPENYDCDFPQYQRSIKTQIMYGKLLLKEYGDKLNPTEEQMKTYYAENKDYYRTKEEFYLKYIDTKPDKDSNDPNQAKAQAKTKAEQILQKIRNGEDFDKLLESERGGKRPMSKEEMETKLKQRLKESQKKMDSNNPDDRNQMMIRVESKTYELLLKNLQDGKDMNSPYEKRKTGNLPLTRAELRLDYSPEFENATVTLKPEQISNVVESSHGFYIIKLIKHVEANIPSFEEVKEQVRQHARNKPTEQAYYEYMQKIVQEADIKYTNEQDKIKISSSPTQK